MLVEARGGAPAGADLQPSGRRRRRLSVGRKHIVGEEARAAVCEVVCPAPIQPLVFIADRRAGLAGELLGREAQLVL